MLKTNLKNLMKNFISKNKINMKQTKIANDNDGEIINYIHDEEEAKITDLEKKCS